MYLTTVFKNSSVYNVPSSRNVWMCTTATTYNNHNSDYYSEEVDKQATKEHRKNT